MTTPTTPAAVSLRFDCEHGSIAYSSTGSPLGERELAMPMKRESISKVCVEMLKAIDAATARESALVAERDALRAVATELLAACEVAFEQTCVIGRPKDWHQINSAINKARDCAALSATAVEGV